MGTMDNGLSHSSYIVVVATTVSRRSAALPAAVPAEVGGPRCMVMRRDKLDALHG
jgi:hypothetical protein